MKIPTHDINVILVTDCGSTTTKARFFKKMGDEYRYIASGEAPTTVETPYEDVTMGIRNAVREVEELTESKLLGPDGILKRKNGDDVGVDLYLTTSSAGGGLQMMVYGLMKNITAESGERAALGAGAIVMDTVCEVEQSLIHEIISKTRFLRPDIILLAGGTDGGSSKPVVELAEYIKMADPKARFGEDYNLPIVYAGNKFLVDAIKERLDAGFALKIVDNIRPSIDIENSDPARDAIHELFMEHVMSHAPGYPKLMKWTDAPIMPTPMGEGMMFQLLAERRDMNVIGVGLGGATTNIYSVYRPELRGLEETQRRFVRTVSANLGMSYSICNVLKEAGVENIRRWVPFDISERELDSILANKMIRPTTIPNTIEELIIEQAVARESLRLAFEHHKQLARGLRGRTLKVEISDLFDRTMEDKTYINMMKVGIIGGTGGLLSHAPRRAQSAIMLIDGFQPEGITMLIQDSVFMMPHLGVLSTVHPDAAYEIFDKDCVVRLGTCIRPNILEEEVVKKGDELLEIELNKQDSDTQKEKMTYGDIKRITLGTGEVAEVVIHPNKKCDVGSGAGQKLECRIEGGEVGIILDCRGSSAHSLSDDEKVRKNTLKKWYKSLDLYPEESW